MKNIGILGSGLVGKTLARGFQKYGYNVMIGSRSPEMQQKLKKDLGGKVLSGNFTEVAAYGEIIVLAVKGIAAREALNLCGENNLNAKIVIDVTNPIEERQPENGVLFLFTKQNESLMEILQSNYPHSFFVKAFNSVGNAHMVDPDFGPVNPTMFICGNNQEAKAKVSEILEQFGWEVEDMGMMQSARAIEPLCKLWTIPGFINNEWDHVLKLLKK